MVTATASNNKRVVYMPAPAASKVFNPQTATDEEKLLMRRSFQKRFPQATLKSFCEVVGGTVSMGITQLVHEFTRIWPNAIEKVGIPKLSVVDSMAFKLEASLTWGEYDRVNSWLTMYNNNDSPLTQSKLLRKEAQQVEMPECEHKCIEFVECETDYTQKFILQRFN